MAEQSRHGLSKAGYTPLQEGAHWLADSSAALWQCRPSVLRIEKVFI
jgi:hypothetical protein